MAEPREGQDKSAAAPSTRKGVGPSAPPAGPRGAALPPHLEEDAAALTELARMRGLRFWDVQFEVITRRHMVELGTYVLPYRWGHWTFGREYARMQKLHDLGLVEILELVINTRPARAYLLDANARGENQMVIAHVLAHVDFFANNIWFQRTPENVLAEAHLHERRVKELKAEHGEERVEAVLDRALSIQWHVDFYRHYGAADAAQDEDTPRGQPAEGEVPPRVGPPPRAAPSLKPGGHRDLLEFLVAHAQMDDLERELLQVVREETLYFYPNAATKIANEGWATYWHAELLREHLDFGGFDAFAVKHSHLMQSEGLNPYKLGCLIYQCIREEWDREHGPGAGLQRILEVRRYADDVSLVRDHLTQEVVDLAGLYLFEEDPETGERVVTSTDVADIKPGILQQIENMGRPLIVVEDGDHAGRGELLLRHEHDGRDLDMDTAGDVLKHVYGFWKRPVHLKTQCDARTLQLSFDGEEVRLKKSVPRSAADDADEEQDGDDAQERSTGGDEGDPPTPPPSPPPSPPSAGVGAGLVERDPGQQARPAAKDPHAP